MWLELNPWPLSLAAGLPTTQPPLPNFNHRYFHEVKIWDRNSNEHFSGRHKFGRNTNCCRSVKLGFVISSDQAIITRKGKRSRSHFFTTSSPTYKNCKHFFVSRTGRIKNHNLKLHQGSVRIRTHAFSFQSFHSVSQSNSICGVSSIVKPKALKLRNL